jgi:hypothetical protein
VKEIKLSGQIDAARKGDESLTRHDDVVVQAVQAADLYFLKKLHMQSTNRLRLRRETTEKATQSRVQLYRRRRRLRLCRCIITNFLVLLEIHVGTCSDLHSLRCVHFSSIKGLKTKLE